MDPSDKYRYLEENMQDFQEYFGKAVDSEGKPLLSQYKSNLKNLSHAKEVRNLVENVKGEDIIRICNDKVNAESKAISYRRVARAFSGEKITLVASSVTAMLVGAITGTISTAQNFEAADYQEKEQY